MERLRQLLDEILGCDLEGRGAATPLRELDSWDSLRHVMLVVGLERTFSVELSADDIRSMVTVADVQRILREKGVDA